MDGKHPGVGGAEDVHHLDGNRIDEAEYVVSRQHLLAEGVELLQFAAAAVGVVGLPACTVGELAGNHGGEQEGKSAIQFCGSAMVKVPMGGRKKKL